MDEIEIFIEECIRNETTEAYRIENSNIYSFLGIEVEGPLPTIQDLPKKTNILLRDFKIENKHKILKNILNMDNEDDCEIIVFDETHPYIVYKENNIEHYIIFYVRMEQLYYTIKT